MTKGVSVHIGLNVVDPAKYDGWDGRLEGCVNDANDLEALARGLGYTVHRKLLDADATAANVVDAIRTAASGVRSGDTLFVTYSGHGGQVVDRNRDEKQAGAKPDRRDETWVLYDRMLIDDELAVLWGLLPAGARAVVLSDSCHSGTVSRRDEIARTMPKDRNERYIRANRALYQEIEAGLDKAAVKAGPKAWIVLLSGCQDEEVSFDGARNGAFTGALLQTWNKGAFTGTLAELHRAVAAKLTAQHPNYFVHGGADAAFDAAPALRLGS